MATISRRDVIKAGLAAAGTLATAAAAPSLAGASTAGTPTTSAAVPGAYRWARPVVRRHPDSLPYPHLPAGTDTLPEIEHLVVLMMENHSYDNYLGMLRRGDGFALGRKGRPTNSNPTSVPGQFLRAYHMENDCQQHGHPSQDWLASHEQYADGRNDGFATSPSGPVAMGYWDGTDLPFYYSLASTFPLADRWFSSVLGQTLPNRRYLLAATSAGMVNDDGSQLAQSPPNGTIFDRLDRYGIEWRDYYHSGSNPGSLVWLSEASALGPHNVPIERFFEDAAAGSLPGFSVVDPDFDHQSEENPQNISEGERFSSEVIRAVMHGPAWHKTLLVWTYDEHGGYYDHVPPPPALPPDSIAPTPPGGEPSYEGFARYGFRVPAVVVSPFAKRDHVSHVIYDHTSILAMVERKWNLPALSYRDANANDLADFLDLKRPGFRDPPALAEPAATRTSARQGTGPQACTPGDPGTIPQPGALEGPRFGATAARRPVARRDLSA